MVFPIQAFGGGQTRAVPPLRCFFPMEKFTEGSESDSETGSNSGSASGSLRSPKTLPSFWEVPIIGFGLMGQELQQIIYSLTPRKKNVYAISLLFFHMFLSGRNTRRAALKVDINMGCLH